MSFFEKLVRFITKKGIRGVLYSDDTRTVQYSLINGLEYESNTNMIDELDIYECLSLAIDYGEIEEGFLVYRP